MRRVRTGLVGAGVAGALHVDALRRLDSVDLKALASSTPYSAKRRAAQLGIPRALSNWQELVADPELEVVHICTPNHLHYPVAMAALDHGKHVVCSHPLALTSIEAGDLSDRAHAAGRINAVALDYRFDPRAMQSREIVRRGDLGEVRFVQGHYLQDSLSHHTDFSWRLEPEKGGPSNSMAALGSLWIDAVQFITGLKVERVLASLHTAIPIRRKPREDKDETYVVTSEDLGSLMLQMEGGAHGVFTAGDVCAGRANDLRIEITGSDASLCWERDNLDRLWIGRRDQPREILDEREDRISPLSRLIESVYTFIAEGGDPVRDAGRIDFPTFGDAYRINCIIDAAIRSNVGRNCWMNVEY